ncbi:MAG: cytochrome b/b6 domain-containing protein [Hyphomonadaceae bacterium]
MAAPAPRYTAIAIVLHWAIAFAIAFMIPLGLWMHEAAEHGAAGEGLYRAFQFHKSVGLTVLALSLARLGWRLINPPPPLPEGMAGWERLVASATHWAFYFLIVALPLSGWVYVSAQWSHETNEPLPVATHWFGLFRVPALFGLPSAGDDVRAGAAEASFTAHYVLAYATIALAALHVAAALKHHFADRDDVLSRMVPGLRAPGAEPAPPAPARAAVLGLGLAAIAAALIASVVFAMSFGGNTVPAPQANSSIEITAPSAPEPASETAAPAPDQAPPPATGTTSAASAAAPVAWRVDAGASSIAFTFGYSDEESDAETPFTGRFARWRADIRFDAGNLDASSANVTIETGSASDGNTWHDRYLPTAEWFDSAAQPAATFRSTRIRHREGNRYEARGVLTIKGAARTVTLPFTLDIAGSTATMDGRLSIDRHDFDVGNRSSDGDDKISRNVDIAIHVVATRAP